MFKFKNSRSRIPISKFFFHRDHQRRRGAAMLELALVLPILLLLILGIIEMGRVMMLNQVTTNACREASRRAIIPGMTHVKVVSIVNSYLDAGGVSSTNRQVSVLDSAGNPTTVEQVQSHEAITIEVQVPYADNTWGFTSIMGTRSLVSRSTMRRE